MTENEQLTNDDLYDLAQRASLKDETIAEFIATSTAHAQVMRKVLREHDEERRHAEKLGLHDLVYGDEEEPS